MLYLSNAPLTDNKHFFFFEALKQVDYQALAKLGIVNLDTVH